MNLRKNKNLPWFIKLTGSILIVVLSMTGVLSNTFPAGAVGGIAMSGSFYQQEFEIPQGSSISGPDIYVVIFNNSAEQLEVFISEQVPAGVGLVLSENELTIPAGGQKQVFVGVEVGTDAVPGKYELTIVVESYKQAGDGIQLAGAAAQKASLTVLGEFGVVSVRTTDPDQNPIVANIRLYRIISGQEREVAYSESGVLEVKVAPGDFLVASFVGGMKLAEESLNISAGENKTITLSGATVYFEGFDLVPNYSLQDGKLAFVQIVYTVRNLYQRVEKGEVLLHTSLDGFLPETTTLATLNPLETGRAGLNYNYIPSGGWKDGSYDFRLELKLDDKSYATSQVKSITVTDAGLITSEDGVSLQLIMVIVGGVVIATLLVLFFVRKARRY